MRTRALFVGLVVIATSLGAGPASAKIDIVQGIITGPGLDHPLRIKHPDTYGLWDAGIDTEGGLDEAPAESLGDMALAPEHLGPRYHATYRFGIGRARQDLYPYAQGGPVAYTPPGQVLGRGSDLPDFMSNRPVVTGWYQGDGELFRYLVERGLPAVNPVPFVAAPEPAPEAQPRPRQVSSTGIVTVLVGVAVASGFALAGARRRRRAARPAPS